MNAWSRGLNAVNDDPSEYGEASGCTALWQEVLIRALEDASGRVPALDVRGLGRSTTAAQAQAWIGSKDFRTVCDLAGMDADSVESAWRSGKFANRIHEAGRNRENGK